MKRILGVVLANALLVGVSAAAHAEEPSSTNWNQVYIGISGGVLDADTMIVDLDDAVFDEEGAIADLSGIAGLYGIQVGANRQFGSAVVGVELDFSGSSYDTTLRFDDFTNDATPDEFASAQLNWLTTLRAKAGLAVGSAFAYVTGGIAFADVDFCATDDGNGCLGTNTQEVRDSEILTGFTVGSGVEFKLTQALSVKTEYLYVDLERKVFTNDDPGTGADSVSLDMDLHIFRAGLNYSFGYNGHSTSPQWMAGPATGGSYADWNRVYFGFSGGVLGADTRIVDVDDSVFDDEGMVADLSDLAGLYGVQAGLTQQYGSAVIGLEADFSGANYDEKIAFDDFANDATPDNFASASLNWLATVRAKAGLAVGNTFAYVTGGIAFADVDFCATNDGSGCRGINNAELRGSDVFTGFTVGSGVEFRLTEAVSFKTEYLYVDLDREVYVVPQGFTPDDERVSVDMNLHVFRAGVNYSFGSGGTLLPAFDPSVSTDWNGIYVGLSGGVAGVNATLVDLDDEVFDDEGAIADLSNIAGIYGIQAGFSWQMGAVVLGLEGDFSGTGLDEGYGFDDAAPSSDEFASAKMNWLSTLRAKAGLAYGNTLIYVTGGLAFADVEFCATEDPTGCNGTNNDEVQGDEILTGFAAGTGVEFKMSDALSLRTEYLFVGLDKDEFTNSPAMGSDSISLDTDVHLFRIGLNYSLGNVLGTINP